MTEFLASYAAYIAAGVMLFSGLVHARHPGVLSTAVSAHGLLPARLAWSVALVVTFLEISIGALAAAGIFGLIDASLVRWVLGAAAILYAAYAAYSTRVMRLRPGVPCGCSNRQIPISGWVVGRASSFAALAAIAASLPNNVVAPAIGLEPIAALLVAVTYAVLLWQLPDALTDPSPKMANPA